MTIIAALPHDPVVTEAMLAGQTVTEYAADGFSRRLQDAWTAIQNQLTHIARKE